VVREEAVLALAGGAEGGAPRRLAVKRDEEKKGGAQPGPEAEVGSGVNECGGRLG